MERELSATSQLFTRQVGALLLVPLVGSLIGLAVFFSLLRQTAPDIHLVNVAGSERMLSEQVRNLALMVLRGHDPDRPLLQEKSEEFAARLAAIRDGGQIMGQEIPPAPPELLPAIERLAGSWQSYLALVANRGGELAARETRLSAAGSEVTQAADALVSVYERRAEDVRSQMLATLIILTILSFIALVLGVHLARAHAGEHRRHTALAQRESFYRSVIEKITTAANQARDPGAVAPLILQQLCSFTGWPIAVILPCSGSPISGMECAPYWHCSDPAYEPLLPMLKTECSAAAQRLMARMKPHGLHFTQVHNALSSSAADQATATGIHSVALSPIGDTDAPDAIIVFFASCFSHADERISQLVGSACVHLDYVIDRTKGEAALRQREAHLRSILDNAADGIISIDGSGSVLMFNRAAERIFGYDAKDMIGQSVNILMTVADSKSHDERLGRFIETGAKRIMDEGVREVTGRRRDGSTFPMELAVGEVKLGSVPMFTGILRDITHHKHLQAQLSRARDEAIESSQSKSEFLTCVTHELRTPLNAIIGFSEAMLDGIDGEITYQQRESLEFIHNSGRQLLSLINNLLDMSKIAAGRMEVHRSPLDLGELIHSAVKALDLLARRKGLSISADVDPALPFIEGDAVRLTQVLTNLIANAIKFTEIGAIAVRARLLQLGDIWMGYGGRRYTATRVTAIVSVIDSGIGIDTEHLEVIFEKFRQVDGGHRRRHPGTGLGLAIARSFVELHGGTLWAESRPNEGSSFTFVIPLCPDDDANGRGAVLAEVN